MKLSMIDLFKTAGRMGITLKSYRDCSQYYPEVREPVTHAGLGNFLELLNFQVRRGNKYQKIAAAKKPISPKQLRIIFLIVVRCYNRDHHKQI